MTSSPYSIIMPAIVKVCDHSNISHSKMTFLYTHSEIPFSIHIRTVYYIKEAI